MNEAARIAADITKPTWVMATAQTGARGRRGRSWVQQKGNLAATLVYCPACTPAVAAQRSFVAANALFEALALSVDRTRLALKWPNDVLLDGGKVAGILLESSGRGPFVDWLSIGVGVNLASAPTALAGAAFPPVSLAAAGGEQVSPAAFLARLAGAFATQEGKLEKLGFARIRQDWLRQAARLGEEITAQVGEERITGIFDTIDEHGQLVLITGRGPRAIAAADVFFSE